MKSVKIIIGPPEGGPGTVDIRAVTGQVEDLFGLLAGGGQPGVVWRPVSGDAGLPFTVECSPVDPLTGEPAPDRIQDRVDEVRGWLESMQAGEAVDRGISRSDRKVVLRMLERCRDGFGKVHVDFGGGGDCEIHADAAGRSLAAIETRDAKRRGYGFAHTEMGSIEGRVAAIGADHQEPSIRIDERVTGREIVCGVSRRDRDEIVARLAKPDAWEGRRLRVSGCVVYDQEMEISRVDDGEIQFINPKPVDLDALHDPNFTGGMSAYEYVSRLRENDFD